jgi:hypothetical protein
MYLVSSGGEWVLIEFRVRPLTKCVITWWSGYNSKALVCSLAWQFHNHVAISFCLFVFVIAFPNKEMDVIRKFAHGCVPTPQWTAYTRTCTIYHSLSKLNMVWKLKSLFYLFVRVYAVLCTVHGHIVFQYNERIIQSQRFSSVIQPCYLNINKPKTKDVHGVRYG